MKRILILALLSCISTPASAADIGKTEICKAAIASIMGQKPSIMRLDKSQDGVDYLSYVRDDGTLWSYRCKLFGNEVIWASDTGRWRTDPADGKVLYNIDQGRSKITITEQFQDGSELKHSFSAKAF